MYGEGDLVRAPNDNRYYYKCIKPGKSRDTANPWTAKTYNVGDVVQPTNDFFFECIADGKADGPSPGKSGKYEPIWDLSTDGITLDGTEYGEGAHMKWRRYLSTPLPPGKLKGQWQPDNPYAVGDLVQPTSTFKNSLFFQCQVAGKSSDTEPKWIEVLPDGNVLDAAVRWRRYPVFSDISVPDTFGNWETNKNYRIGDVVKSPTLVALGILVVFECVQEGVSGLVPPAWKTTINTQALRNIKADAADPTQTKDNGVYWVCRSAHESWINNGDAVWACRLAAGIWLRTRAYLHNIVVKGFTCSGIHLQSQLYPYTNVNAWHIDHVSCHECGVGITVLGGDTNGGTGVAIEILTAGIDLSGKRIPGNGGFAIYDRGNGNSWIGCLAEGCIGRSYTLANPNCQSVLLGCYSEGGQPPSYLSDSAMAFGGVGGAGWAVDSLGWTVGSGHDVQPFIVQNFPGDDSVQLYVGSKDHSNTVLIWQKPGNNYRLRWSDEEKVWVMEWGNNSNTRATYLTGSEAYSRGAGLQGFNSFLLGLATSSSNLPIKVTAAAKPPQSDYNALAKATNQPKGALYKKGDIVFNADPKPFDPADPDSNGHYIGWVCTDASKDDDQVWKGFGKIEP